MFASACGPPSTRIIKSPHFLYVRASFQHHTRVTFDIWTKWRRKNDIISQTCTHVGLDFCTLLLAYVTPASGLNRLVALSPLLQVLLLTINKFFNTNRSFYLMLILFSGYLSGGSWRAGATHLFYF
jgi:hypothetical protein